MRLEDNCCTFLGRNFLITINLLSAIIGLVLCAGGAYLWIEYENQFSDLLSTTPIIAVMIGGFILFIFTMVGIYGAVTGKKSVLIGYLLVVIVLIALEVAASVIFLQYLQYIEKSAGAQSSELQDQTEIAINNFVYRSYQTCCVDNLAFCGNYFNDTNPLYCRPVPFCSGNGTALETCIVDKSSNPSHTIEQGVCTAFEQFQLNDQPLVGKAMAGNEISCGGGKPAKFEEAVTAWLKSNINFFGYGALTVGILEVLIVAFAIALVLFKPNLIPNAMIVEDEESIDSNSDRISVAIPVDRHQSMRSSVRSSVRSNVRGDRLSYRS